MLKSAFKDIEAEHSLDSDLIKKYIIAYFMILKANYDRKYESNEIIS